MKSIAALIPLRDTTVWPGYREAKPIPHRYGRCGGAALQYDDTRQTVVWADHPSLAVDEVFVGGQKATNWTWSNEVDITGRAVTMIRFVAPVPEGQSVVARGRGKLHPASGVLMTNAADVIWDVLANIGALPLPAARLAAFRQQVVDLVVGGSVDRVVRMYEIARAICSSIGAVCSPDMTGFARLLLEGHGAPAVATLGVGVDLDSEAELSDICTDLTIRYAIEDGVPRGSVQYVMTRTPSYGAQPVVIDAPWITSSRVASIVCRRELSLRARPQWTVTAREYRGELRVGQFVELDSPLLPISGTHMIRRREYTVADSGERTSVALRVSAGVAPPLRLERNTNASEPIPTITVVAQPGSTEIEVKVLDDDTGDPLIDADCTLDGQITRRTDSAGIVRFPRRIATPGVHELYVVAPGRDPETYSITVT
jgi:hypothetical protein